jgi:hypothetical protein
MADSTPSTASATYWRFADGSALGRQPSPSPARAAIAREIFALASNLDQAMKPADAREAREAFSSMSAQCAADAQDLALRDDPQFAASLAALVEKAALDTMLHASGQAGILVPFPTPADIAKAYAKQAKDGACPRASPWPSTAATARRSPTWSRLLASGLS